MLANLEKNQSWDFIIIGGGASGLGIALDAAARGYRVLLLEKHDFAHATSSRSTKLIHGGLRYLRSGQFSMVSEALHERALLMQNAPHLVHPLAFIMPTKNWWSRLYYFAGIKLYDMLAGAQLNGRKSHLLSKAETLRRLPTVQANRIDGGIEFFDGQFDDSRLAINLAQTLVEQGGTALNYMPVQKLLKEKNQVVGVIAQDLVSGKDYEIRSRVVINATGAFVDSVRRMDNASISPMIVPSQGAHIVLKRSFFPGDSALIIPEIEHNRVLFFIPWKDHLLVGTTETPLDHIVDEPVPLKKEIEFLLRHSSKFLTHAPTESDILSAFAGIRPLANTTKNDQDTATLSRDHLVIVSDSKLMSVVGGKWTTYRKMGEDTIDQAAKLANLTIRKSKTQNLPIHGSIRAFQNNDEWSYYGSDIAPVNQLANNDEQLLQKMHSDLPCRPVDVLWAVRSEMARNVEDVLARRTRCLLLGAKSSVEIAPAVAAIMAQELGLGPEWEKKQVESYRALAMKYLPN